MRDIFINPSAFLTYPWMAVLVPAQTGIIYTHQTGGVACIPRQVEGYYVPVFDKDAYDSLRSIFEVTLDGAGTYRGFHWNGRVLDQLNEAVAKVKMSSSDGGPCEIPLILDDSALAEIDEAWVPVTSPDGPGILIWENSD
jgi:hypothetical protein